MLRAFVGVISQRGIEVFCAEDAATVRFLWRRVLRERGRSACFWSVIPSDAVELIEVTLNLGMSQVALHIMQNLAREYGLLTPGHEEAADGRAACQR